MEADFNGDPTAVAAARQFVGSALAAWDLDDLVDVAQICTSEVASNAVRHARSGFRCMVQADDTEVVVRVEDHGPGTPVLRPLEADAEHGRGIWLISTLAARWGWEPIGAGKAVWFALTQARRTDPANGC